MHFHLDARCRALSALLMWAASASMSAHAGEQGAVIFHSRCAICHGHNADGKSELARIMRPPPANLRASHLTDEQRAQIVRKGGEAVGRSSNMPNWELELNEEDLSAVLGYVRSVKGTTP
jgi:mono/diheme cytochrome c family protein